MNKLTQPKQYGEAIAINVDMQNDFCEGGSLAVAGGAQAAVRASELNQWVAANGGMVVATADWHPRNTAHFAENGGPWPTHCVANTSGAAFHPNLWLPDNAAIARKGQGTTDDGYSGAEALLQPGSGMQGVVYDLPANEQTVKEALTRIIKVNADLGKQTVGYLLGIAGDWCVNATGEGLIDLVGDDFDLVYVPEATASIDAEQAERKMTALQDAGMLAMNIADIKANTVIDRTRLER